MTGGPLVLPEAKVAPSKERGTVFPILWGAMLWLGARSALLRVAAELLHADDTSARGRYCRR